MLQWRREWSATRARESTAAEISTLVLEIQAETETSTLPTVTVAVAVTVAVTVTVTGMETRKRKRTRTPRTRRARDGARRADEWFRPRCDAPGKNEKGQTRDLSE